MKHICAYMHAYSQRHLLLQVKKCLLYADDQDDFFSRDPFIVVMETTCIGGQIIDTLDDLEHDTLIKENKWLKKGF